MISIEVCLFGLATALIGYLAGNWLSIDRDKRNEFNELVTPIRHDLLSIKNQPTANIRGNWMITFQDIREMLPRWKRKGFDIAVENYKKSKGENNMERDSMGGFFYKDPSLISHAADNLLKYLKPR